MLVALVGLDSRNYFCAAGSSVLDFCWCQSLFFSCDPVFCSSHYVVATIVDVSDAAPLFQDCTQMFTATKVTLDTLCIVIFSL